MTSCKRTTVELTACAAQHFRVVIVSIATAFDTAENAAHEKHNGSDDYWKKNLQRQSAARSAENDITQSPYIRNTSIYTLGYYYTEYRLQQPKDGGGVNLF